MQQNFAFRNLFLKRRLFSTQFHKHPIIFYTIFTVFYGFRKQIPWTNFYFANFIWIQIWCVIIYFKMIEKYWKNWPFHIYTFPLFFKNLLNLANFFQFKNWIKAVIEAIWLFSPQLKKVTWRFFALTYLVEIPLFFHLTFL